MSTNRKNLLKALVIAGVAPFCALDAAEKTAPADAGGNAAVPAVEQAPAPAAGTRESAARDAVTYPYLGVALETLPAATYCESPLPGVQAVYVLKNSPAEEAGLRSGDILISLDGQKLFFPNQFSALVRSYRPGTEVEIVLLRGGEKLIRTAVIGERRIPAAKHPTRTADVPARDDIRIYINGREISLADGAELGGWISLTPNGILIRDELDVPAEFRRLVARAHAKLPDTRRTLSFLRRQYDDARRSALGKTQQTFSQVFFGQGNSVIIVGNEKGRQITVSRADDDEILFRGNCATQEEIDAIPPEAKKIIDSFTVLKPMPGVESSAPEDDEDDAAAVPAVGDDAAGDENFDEDEVCVPAPEPVEEAA